ncbi:MAG TPA: DSD1 family PLP-dependent enzyme [Gemmataceae bacterium]|nr:DSD1 family PLP-dependent enzyme [Gemmataceae bacterium]
MSSYSYADVERMLATGDLRGRLTRHDLPTPALLLDLDAFEANVAAMARHCRERGLALRPHGKTHKCPEIAKTLIRAGAAGACAAKVSEAEVFADHGVTGLLVTTPVVSRHALERAVALAQKQNDALFLVDHAENVRALDAAATAADAVLNVVIDLHVGRKGGALPGQPALALARLVASLKGLKLAGLQAYAGFASHTVGYDQRRAVSTEALAPAVETKRLLSRHGIECPLLTGGSTGTYDIDTAIDGVTELQPGSFIFMDLDYRGIGGRDGGPYRDFQTALTVLTTVVSKPTATLAIIDGGTKAFSTDRPIVPEATGIHGVVYSWGGDEHGKLDVRQASAAVELGDRLEFVVPHCDPTVNLYDRIYCLRDDIIEAVWSIAARGKSQ